MLMLIQNFLWCLLECWWASIFLTLFSSYTILSWHFAFELIWYRGIATYFDRNLEKNLAPQHACTPQAIIMTSSNTPGDILHDLLFNHPWKFLFFFNWPLEIFHAISPWKFHVVNHPVWYFSGIAHFAWYFLSKVHFQVKQLCHMAMTWNGLFQKTKQGGWGYGISSHIRNTIASGFSRG